MLLSQILIERDIANQGEIKEFISSLMDRTDKDQIKAWLKGNLRNWIISSYDKVTKVRLSKDSPDWLIKKVEAGEEIYDAKLGAKFKSEIEHVIDYLQNSGEIPDGKDLSKLNVPDTLVKAKAWGKVTKDKLKKLSKDSEGIDDVHSYDDGFKWVNVHGENSLKREGSKMGHCVGGYGASVKSGNVKIYSLRGPDNNPHVTIELRGTKSIYQIKGKGNERPADKYMKYVNDFVVRLGFKVKGDIQNTDLVDSGTGYVDINNLPDDCVFDTFLDLSGKKLSELPHGLTVKNGIDISGTKISKIGKDFKILGGAFVAKKCELEVIDLEEFPFTVEVTGSKLHALPNSFKCGGNLILFDNKDLDALPEKLTVKGGLYTKGSPIKHLPDQLVCDKLDTDMSKVETYPSFINVPNGVFTFSVAAKSLPKTIRAQTVSIQGAGLSEISSEIYTHTLTIQGNGNLTKISGKIEVNGRVSINKNRSLTSIESGFDCSDNIDLSSNPKLKSIGKLKSGSSIFLQGSPIEDLNIDGDVSGVLDISGTKIKSLPTNLKVAKALKLNDLIKELPAGLDVGGDVFTPVGASKLQVGDAKIGGKVKLAIMESFIFA